MKDTDGVAARAKKVKEQIEKAEKKKKEGKDKRFLNVDVGPDMQGERRLTPKKQQQLRARTVQKAQVEFRQAHKEARAEGETLLRK